MDLNPLPNSPGELPENLAELMSAASGPGQQGPEARAGLRTQLKPQEELANLKDELIHDKIDEAEEEDRAERERVMDFFEGIFGENSGLAKFFTNITAWLVVHETDFSDEDFQEKVFSEARELAKERFTKDGGLDRAEVSHRANGYGKANSPEAIAEAAKKGEDKIEIDLRLGTDGEVYIVHNSIDSNENPSAHFPSLEKCLTAYLENKSNPDSTLFLDVKDPGVIEKLIPTIQQVEAAHPGAQVNYLIMSHSPEILQKAAENTKVPLMFYYYPTATLNLSGNLLKLVGRSGLKTVAQFADPLAGTSLYEDLKETRIVYNDQEIDSEEKTDKSLHIYDTLPNDRILSMIKKSQGYICMPAKLTTPELVQAAHKKGVQVAVWGVKEGKSFETIETLGVDLIITDTPTQAV